LTIENGFKLEGSKVVSPEVVQLPGIPPFNKPVLFPTAGNTGHFLEIDHPF
jgi:hypothetical protein